MSDRLEFFSSLLAANDIWLARGHAIQAYAELEQSLCMCLSVVGDMPIHVAGTIFYKITATRSRSAILESLKRQKFGDRHNLFWNSLIKETGQLDQERNSIVHWHVAQTIELGEVTTKPDAKLIPPNFWGPDPMAQAKDVKSLVEFMRRCDVVCRAISMLCLEWTHGISGNRQAWLDIFQKPLAYPPPDNHPLSQNYKAPDTPPQSSLA